MVGSFSNLEEIFHISLLDPVKKSTIPNWHQEPPPPIIIEEEEEWKVSQILDSKLKRRKLWYLVEWKGFIQDPESNWLVPYLGAQELTIQGRGYCHNHKESPSSMDVAAILA
ncbi:hypothetical protein O181_027060 [Austropuccinia psidii MF-1]|uniref:Chromo domain-containing protein n=1 Tax=Austropuccinia psidii MF-1 TaxID=1389203 RepID=A0A9Q3H2T7_9BASI|nr:hypothetical protein [Austropuccinia psidii MF-1]